MSSSTKTVTAHLISIVNELLIGQVKDTNSAYISKELNKIGVAVTKISIISDAEEAIISNIEESEKHADIIVVTGGLGPTKDDITKHTLAKMLGEELVLNQEVLAHIEELFKLKSIIMNELTKNQALLPKSTMPLNNKIGTAPGMYTPYKSSILINLPGVPKEMRILMKEQVIPKIVKDFKRPFIIHETVMSVGIPESALAEKLEHWEDSLPKEISFAYLPNSSRVRLRISGYSHNLEWLEETIATKKQELIAIIKDTYEPYFEEPIETQIYNLLQQKNLTLAVAESCTGGAISAKIVSQPGVSDYFMGGVVAYSNQIKTDFLKVNTSIIKEYGAVSSQTVTEMAEKICKLFGTNIGIATSGIAPTYTDSYKNQSNQVFVAICYNQQTVVTNYKFYFLNRQEFIQSETDIALKEVIKLLLAF